MARVSQEHLDARRRQILDGARRCFTSNGFHATSMQDVLREAGLSAGAVYRYFRSKEEIVAAVAAETLESVRVSYAAIAAADPPPTPDELIGAVLSRLRVLLGDTDGDDQRALPQLLMQVWGETLRNPEVARVLADGYHGLLGQWIALVEAYQSRGWVDPGADAEHVARTLIATVQGYFVQQALFGGMDPAGFREGLRALVAMNVPEEERRPAREH
ncbi:TetR/AcrR family transcriptional regulator [Streptomyces sp. Amel2xB2]|uniref:TetR/AcrR family transcriptional regulator n=1 Tax=Streptomyces sp. Amel2xB2 TaxID=1305829 RepID=UPI000DB9FB33|nr:TetR/AcrR family transcriptional regulator [Streptomyces sp. Amel2xB2]